MKPKISIIKKTASLAALAAALAVVLSGSVPASGATLVQAGVGGQNIFSPKVVTVSKGSRVTWKFNGPHNVVGKGKGWHPGIKASGNWGRVFRVNGTFRYRCTIHPGMVGTVKVQ